MSLEKAIADLAVAMNRVADSNILLANSGGQTIPGSVVQFSDEVTAETPAETEEAPKETAAAAKKRIAKEKREAKAADAEAAEEDQEPEETAAEKKKREAKEKREAAAKEEEEEEEELEGDAKKATLADVRTAARPFIKANMSTDIREILQEYGADNLKELEAKHFGDVVEAIGGLELPGV